MDGWMDDCKRDTRNYQTHSSSSSASKTQKVSFLSSLSFFLSFLPCFSCSLLNLVLLLKRRRRRRSSSWSCCWIRSSPHCRAKGLPACLPACLPARLPVWLAKPKPLTYIKNKRGWERRSAVCDRLTDWEVEASVLFPRHAGPTHDTTCSNNLLRL